MLGLANRLLIPDVEIGGCVRCPEPALFNASSARKSSARRANSSAFDAAVERDTAAADSQDGRRNSRGFDRLDVASMNAGIGADDDDGLRGVDVTNLEECEEALSSPTAPPA